MPFKLCFLTLCLLGFGQTHAMQSTDTIPLQANCKMSIDNLGNCFIVTPQNDIIKYNVQGQKTASNNVKLLGNIASIDISNPFEIFVFYRDQNQLLILDNMLNIQSQIDLDPTGILQIACLARSSDNQIWLYDMSDFKLKKYNKALELLLESPAFNTLQIAETIQPKQILDVNTQIFVLNQQQILSFDVYANYNKLVLVDTLSQMYWQSPHICYQKQGEWMQYNPLNWQFQKYALDLPKNAQMAYKTEENVYILSSDCLILRRLNKGNTPSSK